MNFIGSMCSEELLSNMLATIFHKRVNVKSESSASYCSKYRKFGEKSHIHRIIASKHTRHDPICEWYVQISTFFFSMKSLWKLFTSGLNLNTKMDLNISVNHLRSTTKWNGECNRENDSRIRLYTHTWCRCRWHENDYVCSLTWS